MGGMTGDVISLHLNHLVRQNGLAPEPDPNAR
jgi:hypothetical protein